MDDLKIHKDLTKTLTYTVNGKNKVVVYWVAELVNPEKDAKLSDEHEDMRWLGMAEAKQLAGFIDFGEMLDYFHPQIEKLVK